jgi:hypothetical protein
MMWKRLLHYQVFNRTTFYSAPERAVKLNENKHRIASAA